MIFPQRFYFCPKSSYTITISLTEEMELGFVILKLREVLHGEPDLELKFLGKVVEGRKNRERESVPLEVSNSPLSCGSAKEEDNSFELVHSPGSSLVGKCGTNVRKGVERE